MKGDVRQRTRHRELDSVIQKGNGVASHEKPGKRTRRIELNEKEILVERGYRAFRRV